MEELRIQLTAKDTELGNLELQNQKLSLEGPSATEELAAENIKLNRKDAELTSEVKGLNAKVKTLTKQLLDAHAVEASIMDMLLKSLFSNIPST